VENRGDEPRPRGTHSDCRSVWLDANQGVANAHFVFPVHKRLNFTLSSTHNYLGDAPERFQRDTFPFTAGIACTLK
jgi:hypothetical protein